MSVKVLLVGGGAREHAMAAAIKRGGGTLLAIHGTPNPGILALADDVAHIDEKDATAVIAWARPRRPDVAVVGPEAPLEAGLVDALEASGIACASPRRLAARIETDKQFMRRLMEDHNIPGRLDHHHFTDRDEALGFLDRHGPRWAIKPVGLTGGKGVQVYGDHFTDVEGAKAYTRTVFDTRSGGGVLQFEELAVGEEFTVMCFTDGRRVVPMPAVQDHKRLLEGDEGPNTGGMGSYSQADGLLPFLDRGDYEDAVAIVQMIVDALRRTGNPYRGTIYGQFMLTPDGPRVIEVNARFGDPEAMNVLHVLDSPYPDLLMDMARGDLSAARPVFRPAATVVRYMVPEGYGWGRSKEGEPIHVDEAAVAAAGATVYWANVRTTADGVPATASSRTLAVLAEGPTVEEAEKRCGSAMTAVTCPVLVARHDIGTPELLAKRVRHMEALRKDHARTSGAPGTQPEAAGRVTPRESPGPEAMP